MNPYDVSTLWIVWKASLLTGLGSVAAMKPLVATLRPSLISLELASTPEEVGRVISCWAGKERRRARWSILIDFVFAISYAAFLGSTCLLFSIRDLPLPPLLAAAGPIAAILALIAAAGDWVENTGMCLELSGSSGRVVARVTSTASSIKWMLVGLVLLYILIVTLWLEVTWLVSFAVAAFNGFIHLLRP